MTSTAAPAPVQHRIARNAAWSFLGMALPMLVALVCIPLIIERLGAERFGVLMIAWLIVNYFGQMNFGLGRATTKFAAEELATSGGRDLPTLVRSSLIVHLLLGLLGAICLAGTTSLLVGSVFNVPAELQYEAANVLYLLAPTIPLILLSDCLRGVLEAHHRFDSVAVIQAPATAMTYCGPLLVLPWSDNLALVVLPTVATRFAVLVASWLSCARLLPGIRRAGSIRWDVVARMLRFGGWVTASALAAPMLAGLDRFTIAAVVSLSAVAWYATPFEVVSKLWLFSGSFLGVLFPVFTALGRGERAALSPLYARAVTLLTAAVIFPAAMLILVGPELLRLWVGDEFALHGAPVVRWLAVGITVNVVAQVPFTLLQSVGHARVPALIQIIQIPCYAAAAYVLASAYGIAGVALAWTLRATIEAGFLFWTADRLVLRPVASTSSLPALVRSAIACVCLVALAIVSAMLPLSLDEQIASVVLVIVGLPIAVWTCLLSAGDREMIVRHLKGFTGRLRGAV